AIGGAGDVGFDPGSGWLGSGVSVTARYGLSTPYPYASPVPPPGAGSAAASTRRTTSSAGAVGAYWRMSATVAETNGVAKLVPWKVPWPRGAVAAVTSTPGATMST